MVNRTLIVIRNLSSKDQGKHHANGSIEAKLAYVLLYMLPRLLYELYGTQDELKKKL